jgi:hypothetical protein
VSAALQKIVLNMIFGRSRKGCHVSRSLLEIRCSTLSFLSPSWRQEESFSVNVQNLPIASPAQISFLRLQQDCKLGSVRLPSLRMLDLFLRGLGHRTDLARNVQEVLALAVSAEKRFDLLGLRGRKPDTRFIRRLSPQ